MRKLISFSILTALLFVTVGTYASVNAQEIPTCNGLPATIIGIQGENLRGTAGDDVIVGTSGNDRIAGFGGNDIICGGDGYDVIHGGTGDDIIITGDGPPGQYINGDMGNDICYVMHDEDPAANCEEIILWSGQENIEIDEPQSDSVLRISTDKPQYAPGETINIIGEVDPPIIDNITITVVVMDPSNTTVHTDLISIVRLDGAFTSQIIDNTLTTNKYLVTATGATGDVATTEFIVQETPVTTVQVDNNLPSLGEEILVSGTITGVLVPEDNAVLIDIISPTEESFIDFRGRTFTSSIDETDNTFAESIPLQKNSPFFDQEGSYTVQVFLVLERDLRPLSDNARDTVLASTQFSILDFQPAIGTIDTGVPVLSKSNEGVLPDPTTAVGSNVPHFLQLPITNNQNKALTDFTSIISIQTPDMPVPEQITQNHRILEVGDTLGLNAGFIPKTLGNFVFTYTIVDSNSIAIPLTGVSVHTVTITGETPNPELTRQELADKIVELEAALEDVLARLAVLEG